MNLIVSWGARTARVVEGDFEDIRAGFDWDERFDVFQCEPDELEKVLQDNGLTLEPAKRTEVYVLPDGRRVNIHADVSRGAPTITYQLADGSGVIARRLERRL